MLRNADWQITSTCNQSCAYCFGPKKLTDMSKEKAFKCVDLLEKIGIEQIGITGGEPLLYNHFQSLIEYIHDKGIRIYLSTNCDYYMSFSKLIKEKVDILGLSIDGHCEELHDHQRGDGNFDSVMNAMNDIMQSESKLKFKIGTVLTKNNVAHLWEIEKLIAPYDEKILYWKLYEMISYERNLDGIQSLKPKQQIDKTILGSFLDIDKIVDDDHMLRDRAYFFIKPNGDVFIPILSNDISEERVIGNLLRENFLETTLERFHSVVNQQNYNAPFRFMGR